MKQNVAGQFGVEDGDAWFSRNKEALEAAAEHDWPLKLIERNGLKPRRVFEYGCANGWRLAEIQRRYGGAAYGCDVSAVAIHDGQNKWPQLGLSVARNWASYGFSDLVVCYFVLHWVDRGGILRLLADLDAVLQPNGYLILGDFLPDSPVKAPYKHHEGLWTYKADYVSILELGTYKEIDRVVFDHDDPEHKAVCAGWYVDEDRRAVCSLLQKGDWYR